MLRGVSFLESLGSDRRNQIIIVVTNWYLLLSVKIILSLPLKLLGTQAGIAGKKLSQAEMDEVKKNLAKVSITQKKETTANEPKKKLFGLF